MKRSESERTFISGEFAFKIARMEASIVCLKCVCSTYKNYFDVVKKLLCLDCIEDRIEKTDPSGQIIENLDDLNQAINLVVSNARKFEPEG
jgi:hypothetical protein